MSAARENSYQYEKVNLLNTEELLKYLGEAYESDKQIAASNPEELSRVLFDVFIKVMQHKDWYSKQSTVKAYQELKIGESGKLPSEIVEDDFKAASKTVAKDSVIAIVPSVGLFSVPKYPRGLEIESHLEEIDLSSPTKKLLENDNKSDSERACSCWPL